MYIPVTVLGLLVLFIGVPILSAHTQDVASHNNTILISTNMQERIDMLIFISPQYADDAEITTTINSYVRSVKEDLGWNTKLILIHQENNSYKEIDQTIELHYFL